MRPRSMFGNEHGYNYIPYSKGIEGNLRNAAVDDRQSCDNFQHPVTPNYTQHVLEQADLGPHMKYGLVAMQEGVRSPQIGSRLAHDLGNSNQNVMFHEGKSLRSETLHGECSEENHTHNTGHYQLPSQPNRSQSESHTLNTPERDFQRPIGSRTTYMGMEYNQETGKWQGKKEGYRHLFLPDKDKDVCDVNPQELQCHVYPDAPPPVHEEATYTSFGHAVDTISQEMAKPVQRPQMFSDIVPVSNQGQNCKLGYFKSTSCTAGGIGSEPSSCQVQKKFVPNSLNLGNVELHYCSVNYANIYNPPMRGNNRPIAVAVPRVPSLSKLHQQHLQESHAQECQLRTHPKVSHPHQLRINPVRMETQSFNRVEKHSHSPPCPRGNAVTTSSQLLCKDSHDSLWKTLQTDLDSIPVPVQTPTVPVRRRDTLPPLNGSMSSSTLHNFTPQSAPITSSNNPRWERGLQNISPMSEEHSHRPVNGLLDRKDWTSDELMTYTEKISRALKHISMQ